MTNLPIGVITPVLTIVDGIPTTTSHNVAHHFNKKHNEVVKRIRALTIEVGERGVGFFTETPYVDQQNGQTYPAYRLTRDGFTLLAMGFTGKKALQFKLAYIEAFNRMEAELFGKYHHSPRSEILTVAEQEQIKCAVVNILRYFCYCGSQQVAHAIYAPFYQKYGIKRMADLLPQYLPEVLAKMKSIEHEAHIYYLAARKAEKHFLQIMNKKAFEALFLSRRLPCLI